MWQTETVGWFGAGDGQWWGMWYQTVLDDFWLWEYGDPSPSVRAKSETWIFIKVPNFCGRNKTFPQGIVSVSQKIFSTHLFYFEPLVSSGRH